MSYHGMKKNFTGFSLTDIEIYFSNNSIKNMKYALE